MQGFITDAHLTQADEVFPGIAGFFASRQHKPETFLELLAAFEHWLDRAAQANAPASSAAVGR